MFDDPVAVTVSHLTSRLAVPVSGRVPAPRPEQFVRCRLSGAVRITPVHRDARISIECWAGTDENADRLAALVEQALDDLQTPWNSVPFGPQGWASGPHLSPDPDSGTPRVVMTVVLRQRSRP